MFIPASAKRDLILSEGEYQILSDTARFARIVYLSSRLLWLSVFIILGAHLAFSGFKLFDAMTYFYFSFATSTLFSLMFIAVNLGLRQLRKLNRVCETILESKDVEQVKQILYLMESYSGNILRPVGQKMPEQMRELKDYEYKA